MPILMPLICPTESSSLSTFPLLVPQGIRHGGDLKLLCPGGRVLQELQELQVLTVLRLLDIIPSLDNEAQALASFGPRSYSASS
jgi:hypothetical protein